MPDPKPNLPPKGVDVKKLLDAVDFQPENILVEAAKNASLFKVAADYRIERLRGRNAATMELEEARAGLDAEIRKEATETGTKITEKQIEQLLTVNEGIKTISRRYYRALEHDEYSKLVVEIFRMRRDMIEVIGSLVHTDSSMRAAAEDATRKISATRDNLQRRYPGEV